MEYGAIDLHLQRSQIRVVGEDGAVVVDRRIATSRTEFVAVFDRLPGASASRQLSSSP